MQAHYGRICLETDDMPRFTGVVQEVTGFFVCIDSSPARLPIFFLDFMQIFLDSSSKWPHYTT
jgi:hypothetical protein